MTNMNESLSFHPPALEGFVTELGLLKEERIQKNVDGYLGEGWSISPFVEHVTDLEILGPQSRWRSLRGSPVMPGARNQVTIRWSKTEGRMTDLGSFCQER
jgi:hypothetical protein